MASADAKGKDAQDLGIDTTATERLDNDVESTKAALGETARVVDHEAERALCRKFDFRLLPVLAVMCGRPFIAFLVTVTDFLTVDLFNALDKGNLGNAQTDGLSKGRDLHL
jgi:hypothetical protein